MLTNAEFVKNEKSCMVGRRLSPPYREFANPAPSAGDVEALHLILEHESRRQRDRLRFGHHPFAHLRFQGASEMVPGLRGISSCGVGLARISAECEQLVDGNRVNHLPDELRGCARLNPSWCFNSTCQEFIYNGQSRQPGCRIDRSEVLRNRMASRPIAASPLHCRSRRRRCRRRWFHTV